jgi:hypothetical protein
MQDQYEELIELAKLNEMVYESEYNFEPKVGQTYHLYRNNFGKLALSLISPPWRSMEYIQSVEFTADSIWKSVDFI